MLRRIYERLKISKINLDFTSFDYFKFSLTSTNVIKLNDVNIDNKEIITYSKTNYSLTNTKHKLGFLGEGETKYTTIGITNALLNDEGHRLDHDEFAKRINTLPLNVPKKDTKYQI